MFRRVLDRVRLTPRVVHNSSELCEGAVRARGQLRCGAPIEAPISRRSCAGFSYRALFLGFRARGQMPRRTLCKAVVYAGELGLRLGDGEVIALEPPRGDEFDPAAHQALVDRDIPGFKASEQLLRTGGSVEVTGRARRREGAWSIKVKQLVQLDTKKGGDV